MLDKYIEVLKNEIDHTISSIDKEGITKAKNIIIESKKNNGRVHVTGIGKPSYVAGYTASLLSSTGTCAYFLDGTEAVHGSSGQVKENDVVIAISNSGETKELIYTVETLKANKAKIITISKNLDSTLSNLADVAVCAKATLEGDNLNKPPRASIIAEIIILQALSILLQEEEGLDNKAYIKWHPGGSLGTLTKNELGSE